MYDLIAYGEMIADARRMAAYARAIEARVTPGSAVLDLGTGPGIFALLACRAGAARVYAVESEDVIQLAREAAAASGFADRIRFIHGSGAAVRLPERVDGIIADIRGALPMFRDSLASIVDARERFLEPGGWMIAARDVLCAALVASPAVYERCVGGWSGHGVDFSSARAKAANSWRTLHVEPSDLAVEPRQWATLDYGTLGAVDVAGEVEWTVARDSVVHGVCCWFDTETAPGHGFSNAPAAGPPHVYGQAVFPFPSPTAVAPGDRVRVRLRADHVGGDYTWAWETTVVAAGASSPKASYRQSTFFGTPFAPARLRKRAHTFVPRPNEDARIDRRILELMAEGLTVGDIADRIAADFPERFASRIGALTRAADLSERYSQDR